MKLSVLDRSRTRDGGTHADALRETVAFARQAEALGYHRFWVSEHHSVPGVAGSAPTVLAAAVASATRRIRVGTGGVMLPNHQPLVVAEQFGVLEALYPGRIDMGLGRSVGFTGGVRRALGHGKDDADRFGEQVRLLLGYLDGTQREHPGVHAFPAEGRPVPAFLLATGAGADLAAELGLPLVIGAVRGEARMLEAIARYRDDFVPSQRCPMPYVIVSATVAVAETREAAERLLVPEAWSAAWSRTHGVFPPLRPAGEILATPMTDRERRFFDEARRGQIAGSTDEAAATVRGLADRTGADEILVTTSTYDRSEMLDSYRLLAESVFAGAR
ncbi:LLM class flavin-dependent oxidoreductase [Amycolatopsis thermophila]|uniref:Luciferase family oxidoreductase group 1 n=1 Tax=Amycolatopsis thermophila TaxID=206084 RepID=A0ABU0EY56_9PSEU|nr:LLM class flavin-dependent oxidoreductase [Amycolatopsis thermophila]MDQ0380255.1 luciferase family oxidoreductase group 1 [Amycolatopsis thermophila]